MAALTRSSQVATVSGTTVEFGAAMQDGHRYVLICTTDCWFRVGATGTDAVAGAENNVYLPAKIYVEIRAEETANGFINVIQDSAAGTANLVLLELA